MPWQFLPSVYLSVRLSHGWISQKRLKVGSCNFHHTVAPSLLFVGGKFHRETIMGSPRAGTSKGAGVGQSSDFLNFWQQYLEIATPQSHIWFPIKPHIYPQKRHFPATMSTHLIDQSVNRPHSPSRKSSIFSLSFFHHSCSGQTDLHIGYSTSLYQ